MEWTRAIQRLPATALLLASLTIAGEALGVSLECPIASSTGQPACGSSVDVGSNAPSSSRSEHVGNPIDVVSGNKYQSEIDIRLGGSRLSLARHYNSSHAAVNLGLGNGWRHTYSVVLSTNGEDIRQIQQSDGRLIEFFRQGDLFRANDVSDGYVVESANRAHVWYLPDGRRLSFHGSFLTRLTFADGERLSLMYRGMRLHSVTDDLGRTLQFNYAAGDVGLPVYDMSANMSAPGHLQSVDLPGGEQIRFNYSERQNLISAIYPFGAARDAARRYQYRDALNHALLTERADGVGRIIGRWHYDELGRAVSYSSGSNIRSDGSERGPPDLTLSYLLGGEEDSGVTRVSFRSGVEQIHDWTLNDQGRVIALDRRGEGAEQTTPASTSSATESQPVDAPLVQRYPHDVLTVLSLSEMGYPATVQYSLDRDATTHLLESEYDQTGRLVDVKWLSGVLEDFNDGQVVTGDDVIRYANRSKATGRNREVAFAALARMGQIAGMASEFLEQTSKELTVGSLVTGQELDQAWWSNAEKSGRHGSGQTRKARNSSEAGAADPCQDPLKDCASLLRTRDYAEVAECAYIDADCSTRFVEADLDELNLQIGDLHDGSFHADVFYDDENDEYIVTFAGTDFTSPGDWLSNIEQEFGFSAFQYEKAVELATKLQEFNGGKKITYTGHSLGGGLATAAAAATISNAFVFNPAALDPDSANELSINLEVARTQTQIYSVRGELLSEIQTGLDFANEAVGQLNVIPRPNFTWVQEHMSDSSMMTYAQRLSLALHGMDAVNQSISDLIDMNQCV